MVLEKRCTNSNLIIQKAVHKDIHTLSNIIHLSYQDVAQTFKLTKDNCPKHPSHCTDKWIEHDLNRGVVYHILYSNGIAAGCAALEMADPDLSYLERLAVLPQFRHNGFGIKLVEYIMTTAQQMGTKTLSIGIIEEQEILRRWYESIGFERVEIKEFDHLPFNVAIMNIIL